MNWDTKPGPTQEASVAPRPCGGKLEEEGPTGLPDGSVLWLPTFPPSSQDQLGQTSARGGFCLKCLQLSKKCGEQRVESACVSRDQREGACARSPTPWFQLPLFCSCTKPYAAGGGQGHVEGGQGPGLAGRPGVRHQPAAGLPLSAWPLSASSQASLLA